MYSSMLLGWLVIGTILFKKALANRSIFQGIFVVLILWWFGSFSYRYLQFTMTSVIPCIAGFLLLVDSFDKRHISKIIFGILLVLLGSFIRYDSFLLISILFGIYTIWSFIKIIIEKRDKFITPKIKNQFLFSLTMLLAVVSCVVFKGIDTAIYKSDPVWNEYLVYNQARSDILDYPTIMPNEEYNNLKAVVYSGNYYDTEILPSEKMQELASYRVQKSLNFQEIFIAGKETFKNGLKDDTTQHCFILTIVIVLLFLVLSKNRSHLIVTILFGMTVFVYLFMLQRYTLFRIQFGILLAICLFLCYTFIPCKLYEKVTEFIKKKKYRVILVRTVSFIFCIIYLVLILVPILQDGLEDKIKNTAVASDISNINYDAMANIIKDKNNLYLEELIYAGLIFYWSGNTYNISIHQTVKKDFFNNIVCLGGWDVIVKEVMKRCNGMVSQIHLKL